MNEHQKIIVLLGTLAFAIMGVYPPWMTERVDKATLAAPPVAVTHYSTSYEWIFSPPTSSYIDLPRLSVQWLVLVAIGVASFALVKDGAQRTPPKA